MYEIIIKKDGNIIAKVVASSEQVLSERLDSVKAMLTKASKPSLLVEKKGDND